MAESLLVRLWQASVGPGGGAAQASYGQGGKGEKGGGSTPAHPATGFTLWPILDCKNIFVCDPHNCLVAISYLLLPINVSKRIMYV